MVQSSPTTNSTGSGAGESDGGSIFGNDLPLSSVGMAALVLLVGSLGVVWAARRRQTNNATTTAEANDIDTGQDTPAENVFTSPGNDEPPTTAEDSERPSLDLLSNEERVVEAIERSGGRMKQQQLVDELGWTDAKTSSVVSQLRDDGTISGFRLGRENVLHLPDEDSETNTDGTPTDE